MTSSRAACVGPFAVSARPTASTAAIWVARRRCPADAARAWATARSSEAMVRRVPMASTIIVTASATPRCRTPGSDRPGARRRDAAYRNADMAAAPRTMAWRVPKTAASATIRRYRHDSGMAARSSLRRLIQKTTPSAMSNRTVSSAADRPAGPRSGEHHLDREIDRGGHDQSHGIRAGDQLDHEGGKDDRHGQDDMRIRRDAVPSHGATCSGSRTSIDADSGGSRSAASTTRLGHPTHPSGGRRAQRCPVSASGSCRPRRPPSRGCRRARSPRAARWPSGSWLPAGP